jgi:transposase
MVAEALWDHRNSAWATHMKRFIQGEERTQATLLPELLDDYISEDNPVRVIDVYVDNLDLGKLGFSGVEPEATGRPGYHPAVMLKLYIYGYLNRIQSTRRLEAETQRNVELMWLTCRLMPDFKTIARFRKDNGVAIRNVCKQFVGLCRDLGLFTQAIVAIDGSKFKAVNSRDNCFTQSKIKFRMKLVEDSINQYLTALDLADRQESSGPPDKKIRMQDRLEQLKKKMEQLQALEEELQHAPDKQLLRTDPDARFMATSKSGSGMIAYNVQTAVDTLNHLIVAHEVTNIANDRGQLAKMAHEAKRAMGSEEEFTVLADKGYYKSEDILDCDNAGITTYVPKTRTSGNQSKGLFDRSDFVYDASKDQYRCPAGQSLTYRFNSVENGIPLRVYMVRECGSCVLKANCTPNMERRIRRRQYENILDALQDRMDAAPNAMLIRKQTVEHPFGTIKSWMGATHFLTKSLERVRTEMSLHVLAYNLKRVIQIMGSKALMDAMVA